MSKIIVSNICFIPLLIIVDPLYAKDLSLGNLSQYEITSISLFNFLLSSKGQIEESLEYQKQWR